MLSKLFQQLKTTPWLAEVLALLLGVAYAVQSMIFAHTSYSVMDEGAYVYKGFLFATGRYWPYQDYGPWTNHMPLSFLIPGAIQVLFGTGLRSARYFMVITGLVMLIGLWILGKRFGGRWWALFAVAVPALNPSIIRYYSVAVPQGTIACMLVWAMVLTLGEQRPLWQLILGSILAGITLAIRENIIPVLPLMILYIFWQHGFRKGVWATIAGLLTVAIVHAIFWPNIMFIWGRWLPSGLERLLVPPRIDPGGEMVRSSDVPLKSRVFSFLIGLRVHLIPVFGGLIFGILTLFKKRWRISSYWRASFFVIILFGILFLAHTFAAILGNYCVFCFSGYLAFFTPIGLVVIIAANQAVKAEKLRWFDWFAASMIILSSTIVGYVAYQAIGPILQKLPVPRFKNGQFQRGFAPIQAIMENVLKLSTDTIKPVLSTVAGFLFGLVFLLIVWLVYRRLSSSTKSSLNFGILATNLFLIAGLLFAPTPILSEISDTNRCNGDIIAAYEQGGKQLARVIPPGSQVDWEGGLSVVPMLYIPDSNLYPPQINDGYSYRKGGNAADLLRYGQWNKELRDRWLYEADYLILKGPLISTNWKKTLESGGFKELIRGPLLDTCERFGQLIVFRK